MNPKNAVLRLFARFCAAAAACAACACRGAEGDGVLAFSTPGPDRYADGSVVADGECYALVWSPAGTSFGGFNADGTAARAGDRVVLAAALARGGRCEKVLFQIPAEDFSAMEGGRYAVCLLDTRNARGVPAGV